MKNFSQNFDKYLTFTSDESQSENDNYIDDLTKIEEDDQYDMYNFYPDAAF